MTPETAQVVAELVAFFVVPATGVAIGIMVFIEAIDVLVHALR